MDLKSTYGIWSAKKGNTLDRLTVISGVSYSTCQRAVAGEKKVDLENIETIRVAMETEIAQSGIKLREESKGNDLFSAISLDLNGLAAILASALPDPYKVAQLQDRLKVYSAFLEHINGQSVTSSTPDTKHPEVPPLVTKTPRSPKHANR
jgi:hypothetical protein